MDIRNDKKQFINNEGKSIDNRNELCSPNDDKYTFVPDANIRAIEKVIMNWDIVKQQWDKMDWAKKVKSSTNSEYN